MNVESNPFSRVRSFVPRAGRMSLSQRQALTQYWQTYGLALEQGMLQFEQLFGQSVPVNLEIGFGMGQALLTMAKQRPQEGFIGIDIHKPGIGKVLNELVQQNITNVRLFACDAVEVFANSIAENSLSAIFIFFPDPWPKQRHHKRRLIQPAFIELAISKLKPGGKIHLATDWQDYAKQMMRVLSAQPQLQNSVGVGNFLSPDEPRQRPPTKFEQRGQRLGHEVFDLIFIKK